MVDGADSILEAYADVLEEQTDPNVIREATSFGTVPTGTYRGEVQKKEWQDTYPEFDGRVQTPRLRVKMQVKLMDPTTGNRKGNVFPEASPIAVRYSNGSLDTAASLWGQIALIHNAAKRGLSVGKVFDEIGSFEYDFYVVEQFNNEALPFGSEGKFNTAKTPEDAARYRMAGFKPKNVVRRISAVKA